MCYFSVAMEIVYGKLGAIRVVTSQLGFARPFSIRFFCKECCSNYHFSVHPPKPFHLTNFDENKEGRGVRKLGKGKLVMFFVLLDAW